MAKTNLIIAALVTALLSAPVQARDYMAGMMLQRYCLNNDNGIMIGKCAGYIKGAADAHADSFCPPEWVTDDEEVTVVKKYFKLPGNTIGSVDRNAADVVAEALQEAFPCKK